MDGIHQQQGFVVVRKPKPPRCLSVRQGPEWS